MRKVLVVDDEPLIRMSLKEALAKWDFCVTVAEEGEQAIGELTRSFHDVVLTDMRMPQMTGMEVLANVKRISPRTGVVMITAYGTIGQAVEAMQRGAFDFITKPFNLEKIKDCLIRYFSDPDFYQYQAGGDGQQPVHFVGESRQIQELLDMVEVACSSDAPVFIQSENGTGKELIASIIHHKSSRRNKPYLKLNCAALPENLIESQLFGHVRGAFTGAIKTTKGVFEEADGGTLLLDEITEMPPQAQAKLLRVLQQGEFCKVGSHEPIRTDVRIVATSNRDVQEAIENGTFRQDLFYRLNVVSACIPPLRARKDDIPLLCNYFLSKYCEKYAKKISGFAPEVLQQFRRYHWPGNVRELENMVQRGVLFCKDEKIMLDHVSLRWMQDPKKGTEGILSEEDMSLREMERRLILSTLKRHNFHKTKTADVLGVTLKTLRNKLVLYDLDSESAQKNNRQNV